VRPLEAWCLPPEFQLLPEERAVRDDGGGAPLICGVLSPLRLRELTRLLRDARAKSLVTLPVAHIVDSVGRVAGRLLDPTDPLRGEALEGLGAFSGFSADMTATVLTGMARGWTEESLWALLREEFPTPGVLDGFSPATTGGRTRALGFPFTFHLGAGSVPGVSTTSMIRALLVKSSVLLRPGFGDLGLPRAFVRGLQEEDPDLARNLAVLYWPAEEGEQTLTALAEADLVVAYGSDSTVHWVRQRLPVQTPLVSYRHRMGFGLVGRAVLAREGRGTGLSVAREAARHAARAVSLFDQHGCVSPHVLFVEMGGEVDPEEWALLLAGGFQVMETELPSGRLSPEDGAAVQQLRGAAEMAEGQGKGRVHHGGQEAPWTVLYLPGGKIEPSCQHRTVRVLPVNSMEEAVQALEEWRPYLQTVGTLGAKEWGFEIMESLARLGVSRIAPMENVPWPPSWWHHDGSGPLRDLVRWTDLESGDDLS
jgi:hypothetical protein